MLELPALPLRAGQLPLADLIDLYMAHYAGRDTTRVQRLTWWKVRLGSLPLADLSDDHVHAAIEELANQHSRYYAGKDADDRPIYRAKKKPLTPATLKAMAVPPPKRQAFVASKSASSTCRTAAIRR